MRIEDLLTVRQAALETGLSEGRIRGLVRQGKLKAVRPGGFTILIPKKALQKVQA